MDVIELFPKALWSEEQIYYFQGKSNIKKVIYNGPCTMVIWCDGSKTIVRCMEADEQNDKLGLALCIAKKFLTRKDYREIIVPALCQQKADNQ